MTTKLKPGPKPGTPSPLATFGKASKVIRVPQTFPSGREIVDAMATVKSLVEDMESIMRESVAESKTGKLNSRFDRAARLIEDLRQAAPEMFTDYEG